MNNQNQEISSSIRMVYKNEDYIYEVSESSVFDDGIDVRSIIKVLESLLINMGYENDMIYQTLQHEFKSWFEMNGDLWKSQYSAQTQIN